MRSIKSKSLGIHAALLSGAVLASAGAARAQVVAQWRFEPGAFTADSSGNGHTLVNSGAAESSDVTAGGGAGSAAFDGGDIMQTLATLDLSPYQQLQITWHQRVQTTQIGLLFEHSPNKNDNPGGFLADVNEIGVGLGYPSLRTAAANNNDSMPHAVPDANNPSGVWEQFTMTLDLTAPTSSQILTVTNGSDVLAATDVVPFRNDTFFIGARSGPQFGFVGNIDELTITAIPEPTGLGLAALGVGATLLRRRRRQQGR